MSGAARNSLAGGREIPSGSSLLLLQQQRRVRALAAGGAAWEEGGEEGLDLFSNSRRSVSVAAGEESDGQNVPPHLGRISVGSEKLPISGMDDLLSAADMGKHDYDWLLTPPGSPLASPDTRDSQPSLEASTPGNGPSARSVSTTRTSRFSVAQLENNLSTRPARSSSATRPSVCTTFSSSLISSNSNRTSILNTSTMSITSSRPSTPSNRSTTVSSTRQSASTLPRPTTSRSSTPSKTRTIASSPGHSSRPSTPTSRSQNLASANSNSSSTVARSSSRPSTPTRRAPVQTPAPVATVNPTSSSTVARSSSRPSTPTRRAPVQTSAPITTLNPTSGSTVSRSSSRPSSPTRRAPVQTLAPMATLNSTSGSTFARSSSRPSTPTRRAPVQSSASVATRSSSVGEDLATNSRNSGHASRPSSPGPCVRAPSQPLVLPDFPFDVPPNLRTKVPERPTSAGRACAGLPLTVRANLNAEAVLPVHSNGRRPSSPVATRGRLSNNSPKFRSQSNGHEVSPPEIQKSILQENAMQKATKTSMFTESTGFGRTISKMSLDMALRHMDIRQGMGGIRGSSLYPQSIRSTAARNRPARMSDPVVLISSNGTDTEDNSCNGMISTSCSSTASENGDGEVKSPEKTIVVGRTSDPDIYESSRYDAFLLKEDSRNLNWLHSIEDKADQSPVFDHSFEPLPEPFVLL